MDSFHDPQTNLLSRGGRRKSIPGFRWFTLRATVYHVREVADHLASLVPGREAAAIHFGEQPVEIAIDQHLHLSRFGRQLATCTNFTS